jgi:hypothetical protein
MALDQSKIALTTNQISETISKRSKGEIYKNPGTLKDAIDKRLKREGYVNCMSEYWKPGEANSNVASSSY